MSASRQEQPGSQAPVGEDVARALLPVHGRRPPSERGVSGRRHGTQTGMSVPHGHARIARDGAADLSGELKRKRLQGKSRRNDAIGVQMTKHAALPGFRDFYPEEMAGRRQIFSAWREVARRYGFEEYDGPPLESLDLYVEKSGAEIVSQLFNFTDKGGREVALRPEMTPTLVRMLGAKIKGLPRPIRWFSVPQLFRYEKQQRGRLREHFQLNMDIVGEDSVLADVDLLAAALDVQRELGLTAADVIARVSDRRLLHRLLARIGVAEEHLPIAFNVIDKIERDSREIAQRRLAEIGLDSPQVDRALAVTTLSIAGIRAEYGDDPDVRDALATLEEYLSALDSLGFGEFVQFDMKIVRGLAYYTGIVFELFDRKGKLRSICGGGRYDGLFSALSGVDVPALGFGMGDVVQGELLKERGLGVFPVRAVDVSVIAVDEASRATALQVVGELRRAGLSVIYPYRISGVGKGLKSSTSAGARLAIVIGEREVESQTFVVRDLLKGSEETTTLREFLAAQHEKGSRGREERGSS